MPNTPVVLTVSTAQLNKEATVRSLYRNPRIMAKRQVNAPSSVGVATPEINPVIKKSGTARAGAALMKFF